MLRSTLRRQGCYLAIWPLPATPHTKVCMKNTHRSLTMTLFLCLCGAAFAAGGGGGGSSGGMGGGSSSAGGGGGGGYAAPSQDPVMRDARNAIALKDWLGAQKVLQAALADSPHFADYHNLYAYAVRKGPNPDMALVFKHYTEALRINPRHLDALEYMGEAYLSINQPEKAKENLQRLDSLCFFGCEQYRELKQAIATYEAGRR